MKAMILAAGRGTRLRPLTDECPKPLIKVCGKPLIAYHIEKLARSGIHEIVINLAYLGDKIIDYLGTGEKWNVQVTYSHEPAPLEVGGGIFNALPLLGSKPFIIVNGDIWTEYDFAALPQEPGGLAHLILVNNPSHNLQGDFALKADGLIVEDPYLPKYTYAGVGVIRPELFRSAVSGCFPLAPLLADARTQQVLVGEYYAGAWTDVGTFERLQSLECELSNRTPLRKIS